MELPAGLEPHPAKEERLLFPMVRQLVTSSDSAMLHRGSLGSLIADMLAEHDRAEELLGELRQLTDGYELPSDGGASDAACCAGLAGLEADTHLHVHKDDNLLFSAVVRAGERPQGDPS